MIPNDPALPALQSAAAAAQRAADDAAGPGQRAQAGAHLRRDHAVGQQALLEELAGARLVHLLAPDRQLRGPLPDRAELLRPQRQQRLRHARPVRQPERPAAQRPPAPVRTSTASTRTRSASGHFIFGLSFAARSGMPRNYISGLDPRPAAGHAAAARLGRPDADRDRARTARSPTGRPLSPEGEPRGLHRPVQHLQPAGRAS